MSKFDIMYKYIEYLEEMDVNKTEASLFGFISSSRVTITDLEQTFNSENAMEAYIMLDVLLNMYIQNGAEYIEGLKS